MTTALLIGVLCGLGINLLGDFAVHFARKRRRQRAHAARMTRILQQNTRLRV